MEASADEAKQSLAFATEEVQKTMHRVEAQHRETERLRQELEQRPSRSQVSDTEARNRALEQALARKDETTKSLQAELEQRIAYLEESLNSANQARSTLHHTRQEDQMSMKQALEESRKHSGEMDQLQMDNEILKEELEAMMTELDSTNRTRSELEQAHATADLQLRQTAQEAEALRTALRQRQKAHEEEVRSLRSRLKAAAKEKTLSVGAPADAAVPMKLVGGKSVSCQTLDIPINKVEATQQQARLRADFEGKLRSIAFLANSRHLLVRDTHDLLRDFTSTRTKAAVALTQLKGLKVERQSKREYRECCDKHRSVVDSMMSHEQEGRLIMDKYFTEWEKLHLGVANRELPEPQRTDILHVIARLHATQEEKDIIQQIAGLLVQYDKTRSTSPRRSPRQFLRTHSAGSGGRSSHLTPRSSSLSATPKFYRTHSGSGESGRRQ
eukprot:TRINITY_DN3642_c0_g2_i1.p1 TRINITY_DN3642_c0_g2~~TRINITY_DN3642_c0_g2_i1.p1  ORF type:complete len:459 (+),score=188.55 TRINITY_DN3642_c0_g2_i1:49-1377(+)